MISKAEKKSLEKDYLKAQKRLSKAYEALDKATLFTDKAMDAIFIASEDMDGLAGELFEKLTGGN